MTHFGWVTANLEPEAEWWRFLSWLPLSLKYRHGPIKAGAVTGILPDVQVQGWAWNVPEEPERVWKNDQLIGLWQRLWREAYQKEIRIIGLDFSVPLPSPSELKNQLYFPGISDGKALELLLFIPRFRSLLHSYEISPRRAKAVVIWEEGNLGLTCARLIAREVRFLVLIHPHAGIVERAAEIILAETGIAPQVCLELPPDWKGSKLLIQCGRLTQYRICRKSRRIIRCELFQRYPPLSVINGDLPIAAWHRNVKLPAYPVLCEVILRASFHHHSECWYGSQLPLERVIKMARMVKEIGVGIDI